MHDKFQMPNPAACASVRAVLELFMDEKPPRSWKRDEQEMWAFLPADIRFAIAKRERERDRTLNICQKELAELRKQINDEKKEHETLKPIENIPAARASATC